MPQPWSSVAWVESSNIRLYIGSTTVRTSLWSVQQHLQASAAAHLRQAFYLNLRLPLQLVSLQFNWIGRCQLLYNWLSENWIPDIFCNTCILVSSCPWYSVSSCHHQNHTFYDWNGDEWKVAFLNITWCRVSARDWLKVVLRQKITKKHAIIVKGLKWKMN